MSNPNPSFLHNVFSLSLFPSSSLTAVSVSSKNLLTNLHPPLHKPQPLPAVVTNARKMFPNSYLNCLTLPAPFKNRNFSTGFFGGSTTHLSSNPFTSFPTTWETETTAPPGLPSLSPASFNTHTQFSALISFFDCLKAIPHLNLVR